MDARPPNQSRYIRMSLRARVALGVALPILLVLIGVSLMHYWRGRQLVKDQLQLIVTQVGEVMLGSLRHSMLANDPEGIAQSLDEMAKMATVQQIQIIDHNGQVKAASNPEAVGTIWQIDDRGCIECHNIPAESRPHSVWFSASAGVLRISIPINNDAECMTCHQQDGSKLGVLLTDISVVDVERYLRSNLQIELLASLGITLIVTLCAYLVIQQLVVKRVERLHDPLARFATGDFTVRLPVSATGDELDELAGTFNKMADELQRRAREQDERKALQRQAMIEERSRIARELHDGLAQLLGYVNTKAMAVRLLLQKGDTAAANQNLLQLEEAARNLLVDVRAAIADLKSAQQEHVGLAARLEEQVAQCRRFSDMPIELVLEAEVKDLSLPIETEAHLARIVQEALTNVQKHASATRASVELRLSDSVLELTIRDNGRGFDPDSKRLDPRPHFGLKSMSERANEIGAEFSLESRPGSGTSVVIRLPLEQA